MGDCKLVFGMGKPALIMPQFQVPPSRPHALILRLCEALPEPAPILRLCEALPEPAIGSTLLPTIGSADHHMGNCKPCAHCIQCLFCHLCPPNELKQRQKAKKSNILHHR